MTQEYSGTNAMDVGVGPIGAEVVVASFDEVVFLDDLDRALLAQFGIVLPNDQRAAYRTRGEDGIMGHWTQIRSGVEEVPDAD